MDLTKRGAQCLVPVPALPHQVVYLSGADGRLGRTNLLAVAAIIVIEVLDDLLIGERGQRLFSRERQDLPHRHPE